MSIAENVRAVREKINAAAERSGRSGSDVLLCAATKMNDASRVREAIAAGVDICGENRVQELTEKLAEGAYEGAPLHFIGHLQKNKVKYIVGETALIHSVDSAELALAINKKAQERGIVQDILLEVNIGAEEAKSGISPSELPLLVEEIAKMPCIRLRGLMAIPPICTDMEENRIYFRRMKQLFIDIGAKKYDNVSMDFLSMGMSADYECAIEEGANIVRVGTGIFGARDYGVQK